MSEDFDKYRCNDVLHLISERGWMVKPFTYGFVDGKRIVTQWIAGHADIGYSSEYVGATIEDSVKKLLAQC